MDERLAEMLRTGGAAGRDIAGGRPLSLSIFTALKYLGVAIICTYMSFPLLPIQGRFWKETEAVLWVLFLMLAFTANRSRPLFQLQDWPCWILLLGLAAGLVASTHRLVAIQGFATGLVASTHRLVAIQRYGELFATTLLLYYIGKALAQSEQDRLVLITLLCILSSAAALYAIWYCFRHLESSLFTRDISNVMYGKFREEYIKNFHPTILGNYLALAPCFALSLLARSSPTLKALGVVTLALGSLVLLIPYWRAAPYVFSLTVCCFFLLKRGALVLSVLVPIFAIVLFMGSLSPTPMQRQDIRNILVGPTSLLSWHRTTRMRVSWRMWRDSPLLGIGFDHYWCLFDKYKAFLERPQHLNRPRPPQGIGFDHYWFLNRPRPGGPRMRHDLDVADNMYCTLLAETGLVGMTGFLLCVVALLKRGLKGARQAVDSDRQTCLIAAMSVLVGLLVSMVGYDLFYWHTPFILFSLVCGLIGSLSVSAKEATASCHSITA